MIEPDDAAVGHVEDISDKIADYAPAPHGAIAP